MATWRRLPSLKNRGATVPLSSASTEEKTTFWGRKFVSGALICLSGGIALSAIDDLVIFHGCSSKALEKASKNQQILEAIGEPLQRGPWYNASLAVARNRHSVSCSFPVSGPLGTGIFQFKAMNNQDGTWLSYLRPKDWDILIMDALLHIPGKEGKEQTLRVNILDCEPATGKECNACMLQTSRTAEKNEPQSK